MYCRKPDLVEVVREAYEELRLRQGEDEANRAAVDNFVARLDPSLVYSVQGEGEPRVHRGRAEVEALLHDASRDWETCAFELDRVESVGCGRIRVAGACETRLPSGDSERFEFTAVWTFHGRRAGRIDTFPGPSDDSS